MRPQRLNTKDAATTCGTRCLDDSNHGFVPINTALRTITNSFWNNANVHQKYICSSFLGTPYRIPLQLRRSESPYWIFLFFFSLSFSIFIENSSQRLTACKCSQRWSKTINTVCHQWTNHLALSPKLPLTPKSMSNSPIILTFGDFILVGSVGMCCCTEKIWIPDSRSEQ